MKKTLLGLTILCGVLFFVEKANAVTYIEDVITETGTSGQGNDSAWPNVIQQFIPGVDWMEKVRIYGYGNTYSSSTINLSLCKTNKAIDNGTFMLLGTKPGVYPHCKSGDYPILTKLNVWFEHAESGSGGVNQYTDITIQRELNKNTPYYFIITKNDDQVFLDKYSSASNEETYGWIVQYNNAEAVASHSNSVMSFRFITYTTEEKQEGDYPVKFANPFEGSFTQANATTTVYGTCPYNGLDKIRFYVTSTPFVWDFDGATSTFDIDCVNFHWGKEVLLGDSATDVWYWSAGTIEIQNWVDPRPVNYYDIISTTEVGTGTEFNACEAITSWDDNIFTEALKKAFCWLIVGDVNGKINELKADSQTMLNNKIPFAYYSKIKEEYDNQATSTNTTIGIDFGTLGLSASTTLPDLNFVLFDLENPNWSDEHWTAFNFIENTVLPAIVALWVLFFSIKMLKKL